MGGHVDPCHAVAKSVANCGLGEQVGKHGASYNFYTRKGEYYVRFRNEQGSWGSGINTRQKTEADALLKVTDWLKNGIPEKATNSPRPVREILDIQKLIAAIRTAPLSPSDTTKIIDILKARNLIHISAETIRPDDVDFISWLKTFWTYEASPYVAEKMAHKQRIGRRHCYDMRNRVKTHWEGAFSGRTLRSITKADLKKFGMDLAKKGLSPGSINKVILAATIPLRWAKENDLIDTTPYEGLMRFSGKAGKRGVLEPDEAAAIFKLEWNDERLLVGNMLGATTGLRKGEILACMATCIGTDRLTVDHSWSDADGLKETKTGEPRVVPLLTEIHSRLVRLLESNPHGSDGFIFYSTLPDRPMDGKLLTSALKEAFIRMKASTALYPEGAPEDRARALREWKERNLCFHSWRHFYSARMADLIDARKVMLATGHKTASVFEAYAEHARAGDFAQVGKAVDSAFSGLVERQERIAS